MRNGKIKKLFALLILLAFAVGPFARGFAQEVLPRPEQPFKGEIGSIAMMVG